METYMAHSLDRSRFPVFGEVASDCFQSPLFSHNPEDTTTPHSWDYPVAGLQDSGPLRQARPLLVEAHLEETLAGDQHPLVCGICPSAYTILKQSLSPPRLYDSLPMDGSISPESTTPGLLPKLLTPSHGAFFRAQPPSPPLDTPELVQRSLPALQDPVSAHPSLPLSTQDLSEAFDVEMHDVEDTRFAQPSTSQLCQRSGPTEEDLSPKRLRHWHAVQTERDIISPSSSSRSTPSTSAPELLTPASLNSINSMSWISASSFLFPEDSLGCIDDFNFTSTMSDWDLGGSSSCAVLSSGYRHRSRSLEVPETNTFDASSQAGPSYSQPLRAYTSPPGFMSACDEDLDPLWSMNVDDATAPHSPRPPSATLPHDRFETSGYLHDPLPLEVDPPPTDVLVAAPRPESLSLPDLFDGDLYISPHSPRAFTARLPELEMEDLEPPSSPRSPYRELLPREDEAFEPPSTISPSLLIPQTGEGLGLFIRPSSIDPPLARSPSPDEDDLHFLDIQLDPASTHLPVDEFLYLRALRRRALDAEREARSFEAELAERVNLASDALLPSNAVWDVTEKRARKYELYAATEMRAEARKTRKREKQRSKEIGALLDLKMDREALQGKSIMKTVSQLVASMVLKRRDVCRPLANRKPGSAVSSLVQSPLRLSVSVEDLMEDDDAF